MSSKARLSLICGVTAIGLAVTGCGGSTTTGTGSSTKTAASTASTQPVAKVSANTASQEDITKALSSAGVPNADQWADEVVEYRPYPANDPNLTKLRDNLAKYNPGDAIVDKIVSALTP
jgi:pectin methylesterase-like acyl-CoA thioesterase